MTSAESTTKISKVLLLFMLIGLVLRCYQLAHRSLWLDEMTSLEVASRSWLEIIQGRAFDNHTPPLYYLLLKGWLSFAPPTEIGLRSLSVVIDTLNIGLCFWAFAPLLPGIAALVLPLLYAISTYAIYFGQEARMYPLLVLFCLLFQGLILRLPSKDEPARYSRSLLLGLVAACGLYTHYYFAPFAASLGVIVLWLNLRDAKYIKHLMAAGVLGFCLFTPWIPMVLALSEKGGQSFRQFLFLVIPYTAFRFAAGYGNFPLVAGMKADVSQSISANLPLILLYTVIPGILALVGLLRGLKTERLRTVVLLLMLFSPPLTMLLMSLRSPMFSERYLCIVFPHFLALLSIALDPFVSGGRGAIFLRILRMTFFATLIFALYQHYGNPRFGFSDWRGTAQDISNARAAAPEGAAAVVVRPEYARGVLNYYLRGKVPLLPFPGDRSELPRLISATEQLDTLFLVESASDPSEAALFASGRLRPLRHKVFDFENGIRLTIFSRPPSGS